MRPIKEYLTSPRLLAISLLMRFGMWIPDSIYLRMMYYLTMGELLNLKHPVTFSEKLQWLKLYNRKPEYTMMVDKVRVKEYVAKIIGREYIIPTLGVWDSFDDIDFDLLPNKFVLKTNNGGGSGGVIVCYNKNQLNLKVAKRKLEKSFHRNIYSTYREWPYKDVQPKYLAEELLEMPDNVDLEDYKFFCFNGIPKYCQVISGRKGVMSIGFFDRDWKHQEFHEPKDFPFASVVPVKPENFELMWDLAEKLALDKLFVRIDFYNLSGKIYFGEITFFPTSGLGGFEPKIWDYRFGELINLPIN